MVSNTFFCSHHTEDRYLCNAQLRRYEYWQVTLLKICPSTASDEQCSDEHFSSEGHGLISHHQSYTAIRMPWGSSHLQTLRRTQAKKAQDCVS